MLATHNDTTTPSEPTGTSLRPSFLLAAALHLAVGIFPVAFTGLLAPRWFAIVAVIAWALAAVTLWRRRAAPRTALLIPVLTAAAWWLAVSAGDVLLGWTA